MTLFCKKSVFLDIFSTIIYIFSLADNDPRRIFLICYLKLCQFMIKNLSLKTAKKKIFTTNHPLGIIMLRKFDKKYRNTSIFTMDAKFLSEQIQLAKSRKVITHFFIKK